MKKSILFIFLLIFLINLVNVAAVVRQVPYISDKHFTIIQQDYLQEYLEYEFIKVNNHLYTIKYVVKDSIFDEIDTEQNFVNNNKVKAIKNKKSNDVINDLNNLKSNRKFPKEVTTPNVIINGEINPFNSQGYINIYFPKGIQNTENFILKIGYGTLLAQFSTGENSIQESLGYNVGFIRNITRYFSIPYLAVIESAYINVTGFNATQGIFTEYPIITNLWQYYGSSSSSSGGPHTASVTFYDNYLSLYGSIATSTYNGVANAYAYANNTKDYPYANLTENHAVGLYATSYGQCSSNGKIGTASRSLYFANSTHSVITFYTETTQCSTSYPTSESKTENTIIFYNIHFNVTTRNATIYNSSGLLVAEYDLSSLGNGDIHIGGEIGATGTNSGSEGSSSGTARLDIYSLGYNTDNSQYNAFTTSENYPDNFTINMGQFQTYTNTSYLIETHIVNITTEFNLAMNAGLCNCSGCVLSNKNCLVPIVFSSGYGGAFNASAISVNYAYDYNLTLIDEIDNVEFDLSNLTYARAYWDDESIYYDFIAENSSSFSFQAGAGTKIRLVFGYYGSDLVTRYIDASLIGENNIRVCVNKDDVAHFEQLLTSNVKRDVLLKSIYANCYVLSDETRYGYENLQTIRAYTTDRPYELTTDVSGVMTNLAGIDGGVASVINLDTLEFALQKYSINIVQPTLSFTKLETPEDTIAITYLNRRLDSDTLRITITNMDNLAIEYSGSVFTDNNNVTLFFSYALINYTNNTLFKIDVISNEGQDTETTITRYFTTKLNVGMFNPYFALIVSILFSMFGLTITLIRFTLGWFGLLIQGVNIAFLSLSITAWYVLFVMGVHIVIFLFILMILIKQNYKSMVT